MDDQLQQIAAAQGGIFTRRQALGCGYSAEVVRHLLDTREWARVRRGAYCETSLLDSATPAAEHIMRTHAVMVAMTGRAFVSHTSATLLHQLPDWGVDLSLVHVTRGGQGGGRIEAGVHHHRCIPDPDHVVVLGGVHVSSPARAVIEAASMCAVEAGVVIVDAALHRGLLTLPELHTMLDSRRFSQGSCRAGRVVDLARVGAESPGETRLRLLIRGQHLPEPELQVPIHDALGRFVGRVDLLFRAQRTIVEFDGIAKYGLSGVTPGAALALEKEREDRLRELGYEVVRVTWADLARPAEVAARIRAAFVRAAARRIPSSRPGTA